MSMNRPDEISVYPAPNARLGIKSSLPQVKSTLALAILFWECSDRPAELLYSAKDGDKLVMANQLKERVIAYLDVLWQERRISSDSLIEKLSQNLLFESQIESLMVAFELVWKLAKVSFADASKPVSDERTGGVRYPKKLTYSANVDLVHSLISANETAFCHVLLGWIGFDANFDRVYEEALIHLLTVLSEDAVFKLSDDGKDVTFNQYGIYHKLLQTGEAVNITGDKEAKGSLRILKSLLSEGLNPYLKYNRNGTVTVAPSSSAEIKDYQKRVDTLLRLSVVEGSTPEKIDADTDEIDLGDLEEARIKYGSNTLLYGVPGSGKSWTIEHEYCKDDSHVERLVFHPDYTYSDFVGQILPAVDDEGLVGYAFKPGPFTTILREAYRNPTQEYILIIEEINRGNAPAIFGEAFQLLDRTLASKEDDEDLYPAGTSEYGITNRDMASAIYGCGDHKVRIPSNLSIIGTMNTSDQNVFTLDTAFQRRWNMRLIENTFENVRPSLAGAQILDTGVTWETFCSTINKLVVGNRVKMASAEDKRLGVYFVDERDLEFDDRALSPDGNLSAEYSYLLEKERVSSLTPEQRERLQDIREALKKNRMFAEKVIKYLWDDAFKFDLEALFDTDSMDSLEKVIRTFAYSAGRDRFSIFKSSVRATFYPDMQV